MLALLPPCAGIQAICYSKETPLHSPQKTSGSHRIGVLPLVLQSEIRAFGGKAELHKAIRAQVPSVVLLCSFPGGLPSSAWLMPVYQHHIHVPAHGKWEGEWRAAHSLLRNARVEYITPTLNQLSRIKWQCHTVAARESENVVSSCRATYLAKILLLWKKQGGFGGTALPHQLSATHYSFIFSDVDLDLWPFRPRATISDTRILQALGKRQDKQLCCL